MCLLLEHKGWVDLAMYVGQGSPKLSIKQISKYQPKIPEDWNSVIERSVKYDVDDGHVLKLIGALLNGERECRHFEVGQNWPIQGPM